MALLGQNTRICFSHSDSYRLTGGRDRDIIDQHHISSLTGCNRSGILATGTAVVDRNPGQLLKSGCPSTSCCKGIAPADNAGQCR